MLFVVVERGRERDGIIKSVNNQCTRAPTTCMYRIVAYIFLLLLSGGPWRDTNLGQRSALRDQPRDARVRSQAVRQTAAITALPGHGKARRRHRIYQQASHGGSGGRGVGAADKGTVNSTNPHHLVFGPVKVQRER